MDLPNTIISSKLKNYYQFW